jgi:hypothetical protein
MPAPLSASLARRSLPKSSNLAAPLSLEETVDT